MNCYDTGSVGSVSHSFMYDYVTPWTVARQALLSMGFFRQEYWSGLPFPSPGDLSDPGIEPQSAALQADALPSEPPGLILWYNVYLKYMYFFGRNNAKAETPVLWPHHAKSWLIGKESDAGKDWGQEEKGMTEDEMAGWYHRLDGRESEWTPGVGDGQGGLACCDSWGHKESDTTEWLNWTELMGK